MEKKQNNKSLTSWSALLQGVPQGSVSGPVLFNIYLNDLFYFLFCDVCNFADDTPLQVCDKNLAFALAKLKEHSNIALKWLENNYMKMNSDKCHLFFSLNKFKHLWTKIGNDRIRESRTVKLLGVTLDNKLKLDEHLNNVSLKSKRKLYALSRIKKYCGIK